MKPFLKWAGGKYKIIDRILDALPKGDKLIEPFAGSGAVFLNAEYDELPIALHIPLRYTSYSPVYSI